MRTRETPNADVEIGHRSALPGSPAVDAGDDAACPVPDQSALGVAGPFKDQVMGRYDLNRAIVVQFRVLFRNGARGENQGVSFQVAQ